MCGICGMMTLERELAPELSSALPAMADSLRHRGPDGGGTFHDGRAAIAQRRLSIIDVAGGAQPMANEDNSVWIVFNGEIYNHKPLRVRLEGLGHVFRTVSDTEAILHAYEEFGPACLEHLEGMFAFAIYDQKRAEMFIARDRLGKKPLFYAVLGGAVHFASEIKAIQQSPAWNDELDLSGLEGYFSLGYFLAPNTIFRHVRKLEPAHWLRVAGGRLETRRYWDVVQFDDDRRDERQIVDELEGLLDEAVRCRLESEVPLGAFLSGGIDSGLVVSYMAAALPSVLTTTVGFAESAHNELKAAGVSAARFGTRHQQEIIEPELDEILDPIVRAFDEPFADSSAIPTYYVSRFARHHVTVALTGDGGDEAFGGYDLRYLTLAREKRARRLVPGRLGRALARRAGAAWPRSPKLPRALRLGNVLENLGHSPEAAYYADLCFFKPWDARALLGIGSGRDPADSPVFEAVAGPYRRCPSTDPVQQAQYADLNVYMPNDPLVKVDRMSMVHSLEIRCPLLDRRIIEFAFRIPASRKIMAGQSKYLLRQLARRRLPPELASLPKRGFTAPIGHWIAGEYADRYQAEMLESGSSVAKVLDIRRLRSLFQEHRSGSRDHWFILWAAWVFERWHRTQGTDRAPGASVFRNSEGAVGGGA
jgi:asparagine synthase (glutamine-hydrolysing)